MFQVSIILTVDESYFVFSGREHHTNFRPVASCTMELPPQLKLCYPVYLFYLPASSPSLTVSLHNTTVPSSPRSLYQVL